MLTDAPFHPPQDRQAAVNQLLMEIHDAIGSFVACYTGRDQNSGASGPACEAADAEDGPAPQAGRAAARPHAASKGASSGIEGASGTGAADPVPARDLDATVRGHHIRAGRALLDWAMSDLSDASGLSLSTVRRLEQDGDGVLTRNRRSAIQALQQAGVCFLSLSDGTVAVAKQGDAAPVS